MNLLLIFVPSLISGLLGVLISAWFFRRAGIRQGKLRILQQLLGNRNDIRGQAFTEALNQVFVGFHDSREVLLALKSFYEVIIDKPNSSDLPNQKLLDLFKAMCHHLKIDPALLTDDFFLQPFNVRH
ncbi:hypothetical protein M1506_03710 [Patescibacteria group bacterium]|nr:hypothetical protein [Patescibacteria group bacterium]